MVRVKIKITMISHRVKVQEKDSGKRIDVLAVEETGITRSQIQRLIKKGFLLVDNRAVSQNYRVKAGDIIVLTAPSSSGNISLQKQSLLKYSTWTNTLLW